MTQVLFYLHYALLLAFGQVLAGAYAGVQPTRKNAAIFGGLFVLCGLAQCLGYFLLGEDAVWKIYPLIVHLPLVLVLRFVYNRRFTAALAATASAYLCCQPAKWFGLLVMAMTGLPWLELLGRIMVLALTAVVVLGWFAPAISHIYSQNRKSVWVFGITPMVYYIFDYVMGIYTDLWANNIQVAVEFLPFFLCLGHLTFCRVYHLEYQHKADAERKEQLLRITTTQQAREIEAFRRGEYELRLLRHDMRLFLNSLAVCIDQGDLENARKMVAGYASQVENTGLRRYCRCDTLNYVLWDFAARCQEQKVSFQPVVELTEDVAEEMLLSIILSNALDNALNAQLELPEDRRNVQLLLKHSQGKLLLSVKNPCARPPKFADGLPVTNRPGHGYGTQSIRHTAQRLGGNCRFSMEGDRFVVQVVI